MPERIIIALKLSSTVQDPAAKDSDVDPDHKIDRKSSHFCGHQEVCSTSFSNTLPGKMSFIHTYIEYAFSVHYITCSDQLKVKSASS